MATSKRPVLTAQLPPTPCTPEMRKDVVGLAEKQNITIAEIQRQAFALFLRVNDTNCINEETKFTEPQEQRA